MFDSAYQIMAQIFIAVALIPIWFMLRKGRGKSEPQSALWTMILFGVLSVVLTFIFAIPLGSLFPEIGQIVDGKISLYPPENLLLSTILFASIEEIAKFIPAAIYLYRKPYFNWRSDGILYFGLIGLTFGFIEDMLYVAEGGIAVGIIRIVFGLFFHGAVTAIVGYTLSRKKVVGGSWLTVLIGLALAIGFHTLYNYGLFISAWEPIFVLLSIGITLAVNANFFIMFWLANRKDHQQFVPVTAQTQTVAPGAVASTSVTPQSTITDPQPMPAPVIHAGAAMPLSITSLVLGIISIFSWIVPFFGLVPPMIALILGITMLGKDSNGRSYNLAGSILGGIGLLISLLFHVFLILIFALGS